MEISKEEFDSWRNHPVTLEVMEVLRERARAIGDWLGLGACLGDEGQHGKAVGRFLEIHDLINMEYEDMLKKDANISQA